MNFLNKNFLLFLFLMLLISFKNTNAQSVNNEMVDSLLNSLPETPYLIEGINDSTDYSKEKIEALIDKVSDKVKNFKFSDKDEISRITVIQKQIDNHVNINIGRIKADLERYQNLSNLLQQFKDGKILAQELVNIEKTIDTTKDKFLHGMNSTVNFDDLYYIKINNIDLSKAASYFTNEFTSIIRADAIDRNLGTSIQSNTLLEDSKVLYDSVSSLLTGKISGSILKNRTNFKDNYLEVVFKTIINPNYNKNFESNIDIDFSNLTAQPVFFSLLSEDSTLKRNQVLDNFIDSDDIINEINNCNARNAESNNEVRKKFEAYRKEMRELQRAKTRIIVDQKKRNDTLHFILRNLRIPHNPNTEVKDYEIDMSIKLVTKRLDSLYSVYFSLQENKLFVKTSGNEIIIDQDARKAIALKIYDYLLKMKTKNSIDVYAEKTLVVNKRVESALYYQKSDFIKDFDFISFYLVPGENSNLFIYPIVKYKLRSMKSTKVNFIGSLNYNVSNSKTNAKGIFVKILSSLCDEDNNNKDDSEFTKDFFKLDAADDFGAISHFQIDKKTNDTSFMMGTEYSNVYIDERICIFFSTIGHNITSHTIVPLNKVITPSNFIEITFSDDQLEVSGASLNGLYFESLSGGILTMTGKFFNRDAPSCCPTFEQQRTYSLDINTGFAKLLK